MAERKTYTVEQKKAALEKVAELGITKASKELGISINSLVKWRADAGLEYTKKKVTAATKKAAATKEEVGKTVEEKATAAEIEVKKKTRSAARKAKETAEKVAADVSEQAANSSVEIGKTVKKAGRKAKEKISDTAAKAERDSKLNIVVQSNDGHAITALQISKMVPEGTTDCYVKAEENKIYYVLKDGSTGSINIW